MIEPNDPSWERLEATSKGPRPIPSAWLAMEDIYGDVGNSPVFGERFAHALAALWKDGTAKTLQRYIDGRL